MATFNLDEVHYTAFFAPNPFCETSLPSAPLNCTARSLSVHSNADVVLSFFSLFRSRYSSGPTPIMSAGDPSSTRSVSAQLNTPNSKLPRDHAHSR